MKSSKISLSAVLLLGAQAWYAQGYQVNLQGQVQTAMGGAGTANVQDGAILFFNPGGTSFLKGNAIDLGASATISKVQFLDKYTNQKAETVSPMSTPFGAYAAFGKGDSAKLKYGLAVYTPFGSTVQWEDGWMGRYALTRLQLQAIFFQPTISYRINSKIGIGAGFVYANGKVNLQKDIPVVDNAGNVGHAELNGKASGMGFNAGVYAQLTDKFSAGLTYRSQVNMKVEDGDATFTVPASLAANFPNGKFTSSLPLPQVVTLGLAYKLSDKLKLALDVNYVGWSAYDTLAFDYATNTTSLVDTKSARRYKNSVAFRCGAQYMVTEQFAVRAGIAYALSPVQDGYVTPETPDANRINGTVGIGYAINKSFGLNASFLFTTFKREATNFETNLTGTFKTVATIPGLSLFYKF